MSIVKEQLLARLYVSGRKNANPLESCCRASVSPVIGCKLGVHTVSGPLAVIYKPPLVVLIVGCIQKQVAVYLQFVVAAAFFALFEVDVVSTVPCDAFARACVLQYIQTVACALDL